MKEVSAQSISTAFAPKRGATDDYGGSLSSFAARLAPNSGAGDSSSFGDSVRSFEQRPGPSNGYDENTGTFSAQALAPAPGSDTASPQKAAAAAAGLVPGTQPVDLRNAPLAAPTPAPASAASAPAKAAPAPAPTSAAASPLAATPPAASPPKSAAEAAGLVPGFQPIDLRPTAAPVAFAPAPGSAAPAAAPVAAASPPKQAAQAAGLVPGVQPIGLRPTAAPITPALAPGFAAPAAAPTAAASLPKSAAEAAGLVPGFQPIGLRPSAAPMAFAPAPAPLAAASAPKLAAENAGLVPGFIPVNQRAAAAVPPVAPQPAQALAPAPLAARPRATQLAPAPAPALGSQPRAPQLAPAPAPALGSQPRAPQLAPAPAPALESQPRAPQLAPAPAPALGSQPSAPQLAPAPAPAALPAVQRPVRQANTRAQGGTSIGVTAPGRPAPIVAPALGVQLTPVQSLLHRVHFLLLWTECCEPSQRRLSQSKGMVTTLNSLLTDSPSSQCLPICFSSFPVASTEALLGNVAGSMRLVLRESTHRCSSCTHCQQRRPVCARTSAPGTSTRTSACRRGCPGSPEAGRPCAQHQPHGVRTCLHPLFVSCQPSACRHTASTLVEPAHLPVPGCICFGEAQDRLRRQDVSMLV